MSYDFELDTAQLEGGTTQRRFVEAPAPMQHGVILQCGSDLTPEPVRWLWPDWLALGKLHVLAGAPGQGKTTLAMDMAATVTSGGLWPDGSPCERGNVVIWSGEDDPADTLLPRIMAAGGDRSRVHFISGAMVDGEAHPFDPARDMPELLAAFQRIGDVRLLIVDPIVAAVAGDSHKNAEVRRSLQPLVDLATQSQCALLGITHFSKGGQGGDPAQRVIGSVAFTAVARVVLVAAKVQGEDGEDRRILARSKSNIGPDDGGFEYRLEQVPVTEFPGIQAARIAWGEAVEGSAQDLLAEPGEKSGAGGGSVLVDLLRARLVSDNWTSAKDVSNLLLADGYTNKQIYTASVKLKVLRRKSGMGDGWLWRLPPVPGA